MIVTGDSALGDAKIGSFPFVMALLFICLPAPAYGQHGTSSGAKTGSVADTDTFRNPLKDNGADPWVFVWNGSYYYTNTTGRNVTLWKTSDITSLRAAEKKVIWTPEPGHPWSSEVWAPEVHRWGSKWYIYFAADAGDNTTHRIFVLENSFPDPMAGEWRFKGKVSDSTDRWAIDVDVFEVGGQHYMLWSGWQGAVNGEQDIFIAHMRDPWTIDSPRTLISSPDHAWERNGDLPGGRHVNVNEGPEALVHGDDVFVVYSGSGCWTDEYALGTLRAAASEDLLKSGSWKKLDGPLLSTDAWAHTFGPGHNGFFKSPNGKQDWIIYHASPEVHQGCGGHRSPRLQRFTWNADGSPNLGRPASTDSALPKPPGS